MLAGCAALTPPPGADTLAALPVVAYPATPPAGQDDVYKLPAGVPVELRVRVDGSAIDAPPDRPLSAPLTHDLYLHKQWASEDGRHGVPAQEPIGVSLDVRLPSYEAPGSGLVNLKVHRRQP